MFSEGLLHVWIDLYWEKMVARTKRDIHCGTCVLGGCFLHPISIRKPQTSNISNSRQGVSVGVLACVGKCSDATLNCANWAPANLQKQGFKSLLFVPGDYLIQSPYKMIVFFTVLFPECAVHVPRPLSLMSPDMNPNLLTPFFYFRGRDRSLPFVYCPDRGVYTQR